MANCGCTPLCSCVIQGDGTTVTVSGLGTSSRPFTPTLLDSPNPTPVFVNFVAQQTFGTVETPVLLVGDDTYTIPRTGLYLLSGFVMFSTTAATFFRFQIMVNVGTAHASHSSMTGTAACYTAKNLERLRRFNSGDVISMVLLLGAGTSDESPVPNPRGLLGVKWLGN